MRLQTVCATAALCFGAIVASAQDSLTTRAGVLAGTRDGTIMSYKGIPYAAAPVGALRWKPPQPAVRWDGVRQAKSFGLQCPQPPFPPGTPPREWSEDCLTLNVWTPVAPQQNAALPVLVVIHGGGFFSGSGSDPALDGGPLAKRNVVVVTFNYRLGVFGFFAHPALSKESSSGTSGNYGLMDQIAALRWVRDNISAFGGDPSNVTISGNSAGGSSVLYLMLSPLARGLFARGISQSAALGYGPLGHVRERRYGIASAESDGLRVGANIAELRALSAPELFARGATRTDIMFTEGPNYWPMVDGVVLPDEPWVLFESGRFTRVPLIIGSTADEGTLFASVFAVKTVDAWRQHLARRHPGVERIVQAEYLASTDSEVQGNAVRWVNDWYFHGTARGVARAVSSHGVPVFVYNFSRVPPLHPLPRAWVGAFHSAEIDYVFGERLRVSADRYEEADQTLSRAMNGAWLQFARSGDPNGEGVPMWPRYQTSTDQHLDFGTVIRAGSGLHARSLDVFDSAFAKMRAVYRKRE